MINLSDETSTERGDHDQSKEEDLNFEAPLSSNLRRKHKQPFKEAQTAPPVTPVLTKQRARRCPARHHYQLHHPAHHHYYQGQEGQKRQTTQGCG